MILKTLRFGEIDIKEDDILQFPQGLFAFEEHKKYILVPVNDNPFFRWLQCVDEPKISFLLIDPFVIRENYYVELDDSLKEELGISKQEDVVVYTIVTLPEGDFQKSSTNLLAPLVINLSGKKAKQVLLDETRGQVKEPLFPSQDNRKVSGG
ncbi:MAG: hypothetical protein APF76_02325 [Desulfitibacter sp. BRH_c19]|nr:MAG: hypothetical protein APF76_02325 [Desulfitibacter sp. BRH_c19]